MANTISNGPIHPWMPKAWIMLWYYLHSNPYISYVCSKLILFDTQFNWVEVKDYGFELNISFTGEFFPEINSTYDKKIKANLYENSRFQLNRTEKTTEKGCLHLEQPGHQFQHLRRTIQASKTTFSLTWQVDSWKQSWTFHFRPGKTI